MITTQILIFTVLLISSVREFALNESDSVTTFITCPATTTGGATKPDIKQFAIVDNKIEDPTRVEEELNRSYPVKTSVPTKICQVATKSISLFFWPFRKSWKAVKGFTPSFKNIFAKQAKIKNEINIQ